MNKNKIIQIRITGYEYLKFKDYCDKNNVSMSDTIRQYMSMQCNNNGQYCTDKNGKHNIKLKLIKENVELNELHKKVNIDDVINLLKASKNINTLHTEKVQEDLAGKILRGKQNEKESS